MKEFLKKVFRYVEPIWLGADGKISLRAVLAIFFSWKMVQNLDYGVRKWAADRSLEGLNSLLIVLAGLIAALLGITAWSNMTAKRIDTDANIAPNTSITVQKAETVTTGPSNGNQTTQTDSKTQTTNESFPVTGNSE